MAEAAEGIQAHRTPIDKTTGLATDFLNQFNEVTMILEMVADMPELFEDIRDWRPRSYEEHFRASGFHDMDVIIAAYEASPKEYRQPFDETTEALNQILTAGLSEIAQSMDDGDEDGMADKATETQMAAMQLMEQLNAILHGNQNTTLVGQDEIDEMMSSQADIDALFD